MLVLHSVVSHYLNTLRPRRNEQHFADDIFKRIFFNENVWISIKISLKFVPKGPINNIPALVQIMAWRRPGDKPLSEPMMVRLPTHICVTRPQWVNHGWFDNLVRWFDGIAANPQVVTQKHFQSYSPSCCIYLDLVSNELQKNYESFCQHGRRHHCTKGPYH